MSDIVPLLRSDLVVSPRVNQPGLTEVGRRGEEKTFTLYDFEVSIARMLNGRRTVSELIEAASRIGIPVTLDSFQKFVRQMRAYGFIEDAPPPVAEEDLADTGPWPPRSEWEPQVRELFQSALRTYRMNRFTEARSYVEALLQIQPEIAEAIELLARIEERIDQSDPGSAEISRVANAAPAAPEPLVPDVPEELPPPPSVVMTADGTLEPTVVVAPPQPQPEAPAVAVNPEPQPLPVPDPAPEPAPLPTPHPLPDPGPDPEPAPVPSLAPPAATVARLAGVRSAARAEVPKRNWKVVAAAAAALVVLGGAAAVPVPSTVTAAAEVEPAAEAVRITAARSGKLAALLVEAGAWVKVGDAVARLDDAPIVDQLARVDRDLSAIDGRIARLEKKQQSSRAKKARALLAKKEAELARLNAQVDRLSSRKQSARTRKTLKALERKVRKKELEVARARKSHEAAAGAKELEALQAKRQSLSERREKVDASRKELTVHATAEGLFQPSVAAGAELSRGATLATIEDVRVLRVRIAVPSGDSERVAEGDKVLLTFAKAPDAQVTLALANLKAGANGGPLLAEAELANADRKLPHSAEAVAQIQCRPRSLIARVMQ